MGYNRPMTTHIRPTPVTVVTPAVIKPPRSFCVVMLNDDFTPMDFVVDILERIFGLDEDKAQRVMLQVHHEGKAVVGQYSRELGESKIALAHQWARKQGHPFRCVLEPA